MRYYITDQIKEFITKTNPYDTFKFGKDGSNGEELLDILDNFFRQSPIPTELAKYNALTSAGVDNWSGYDLALEDFPDV